MPEGAEVYYTDSECRIVVNPAIQPPGTQLRRFYRFLQKADFTHWPHGPNAVVDDMLRNERRSGQF